MKVPILHLLAKNHENSVFFEIRPLKKGVKRVTKSDKIFGKWFESERLVLNCLWLPDTLQVKNAAPFVLTVPICLFYKQFPYRLLKEVGEGLKKIINFLTHIFLSVFLLSKWYLRRSWHMTMSFISWRIFEVGQFLLNIWWFWQKSVKFEK